jgi:hypothetical protein
VLFVNAKLASNAAYYDSGNAYGWLYARNDGSYTDGSFVYGYMQPGELTSGAWYGWANENPNDDLAFTATFRGSADVPVVPLPTALLGGGALLAGLGALRRCRPHGIGC